MLPNTEHLFFIRHDTELFEKERACIINEYISCIPEEHRAATIAMQSKIDAARSSMSQEQLLSWMQNEASELSQNLSDLFVGFSVHAKEIKRILGESQ